MADTQGTPEWRVIGETVRGASHERAGLPNQDAILQVRESGRALPLIVSVSDGHGSNKCFRSDRGSRLAVREAAELVKEFLDERRGAFDAAEIECALKESLPREFVRRWREAVGSDLKARPFAPEELAALETKDGARAHALVEANPLLAYGATSLTVAVEDSFILYLQLGDGEILTVSESGGVEKALHEDERLFANETTSLCTADAEKNFRSRLQTLADSRPALLLVSTDGYANSFSDEAGFLKVGSDLLEMLRADGFDPINASLKGWLEEATRAGSGDDTTLAIICRMDALKEPLAERAGEAKADDDTVDAAVAATNAAASQTETTAPQAAPAEAAPTPASGNAVASALATAAAPPTAPRTEKRRKTAENARADASEGERKNA